MPPRRKTVTRIGPADAARPAWAKARTGVPTARVAATVMTSRRVSMPHLIWNGIDSAQ
jgi:hypothetical protein